MTESKEVLKANEIITKFDDTITLKELKEYGYLEILR